MLNTSESFYTHLIHYFTNPTSIQKLIFLFAFPLLNSQLSHPFCPFYPLHSSVKTLDFKSGVLFSKSVQTWFWELPACKSEFYVWNPSFWCSHIFFNRHNISQWAFSWVFNGYTVLSSFLPGRGRAIWSLFYFF